MRACLGLTIFVVGSMGVLACGDNVATPSTGGTGGTPAVGTGAGSTSATTGVGMGGGAMVTGTSTGTLMCPFDPQDCSPKHPCPQGFYCYATDPCGDFQTCQAIPAACAATPTCDCLKAQTGPLPLSANSELACSSDANGVYTYGGGESMCCP